jgi:tRNA-dihydrouridine synthase B
MDGITDMAYRELVSEMGGSSVVYCEFVNVKGIIYENPKTFFELTYTKKQRPVVVQLFGSDPDDFYEAAKVVVKLGFDAIDINMGCPAHKVAAKGGGCALMADTGNARRIVEMTIKGANESWKEMGGEGEYEVTTKMRLGVHDKDTVFTHGMAMLEGGSKAVAIHGRTLKQMYTGEADWEPIKKFKQLVYENSKFSNYKPKVFGSGDVKNHYEAFVRLITTGADGVMIGRGSFGNPWIFDKDKVDLLKKHLKDSGWPNIVEDINTIPNIEQIKKDLESYIPSFEEMKNMALHHAALMVADKGEKGMVQMRKHFAWYFTSFDGAKELRNKLVRVNTLDEATEILTSYSPPAASI